MEIYNNLGGDSSISEYECGSDFILVLFNDGWRYTYTYESTGFDNIEHMKELAFKGEGLGSFIRRHIKKAYASKER